MPLMTLHAAVELLPFENESTREADLERLERAFPKSPFGHADASANVAPLVNLRVAWEMHHGEVEAVHVKVMIPGISFSREEAESWINSLLDTLPSMGPEILGALAHGVVHLSFDANAEGWTFCPDTLSAHDRLAHRANAIKTILGRQHEDIIGELTENSDPRALPVLLAQCPLPDTGS